MVQSIMYHVVSEIQTMSDPDNEKKCVKIPNYDKTMPTLLFYVLQDTAITPRTHNFHFNLSGFFLDTEEEFSVTLLNETIIENYDGDRPSIPWTGVKFVLNDEHLDILYSRSKYDELVNKLSVMRNGECGTITRVTRRYHDNLLIDWKTSDVYIIFASRIKQCDRNVKMCIDLKSQLIEKPTFMTISQKHRILFWIDGKQTEGSNFQLNKYQLNNSSAVRIVQGLKSPSWLTIDPIRDRIYWMDVAHNATSIISTTFDGINRKVILSDIPKSTSSFAVFNNTLYWPNGEQRTIWTCPVTNCARPIVLKTFSSENNLEIGNFIVDYLSVASNEVDNKLCQESSCSHFCKESGNTYTCYCPDFELRSFSAADRNAALCMDTTLVVTYGNALFVIGFSRNPISREDESITREIILNISSISAVTYNSLEGSIIVAEEQKQRFYSYLPRSNGKLEFIFDNGPGTVNSIGFDDLTNNLYWINPINYSVVVVNLRTRRKATIFEGNSTYSPIQLVLVPEDGYMFVSFLKSNSSIVIERTSMDGRPKHHHKVVYETLTVDTRVRLFRLKVSDLIAGTAHTICVFDESVAEFFRCFSDHVQVFWLKILERGNRLETGISEIVFSSISLWWFKDNVTPHIIRIHGSQTEKPIELHASKTNAVGSIWRITTISESKDFRFSTECLRNNGGCTEEEICLNSAMSLSYSCVCADDAAVCGKSEPKEDGSMGTLKLFVLMLLSSVVGGVFSICFLRRLKNLVEQSQMHGETLSNSKNSSRHSVESPL